MSLPLVKSLIAAKIVGAVLGTPLSPFVPLVVVSSQLYGRLGFAVRPDRDAFGILFCPHDDLRNKHTGQRTRYRRFAEFVIIVAYLLSWGCKIAQRYSDVCERERSGPVVAGRWSCWVTLVIIKAPHRTLSTPEGWSPSGSRFRRSNQSGSRKRRKLQLSTILFRKS